MHIFPRKPMRSKKMIRTHLKALHTWKPLVHTNNVILVGGGGTQKSLIKISMKRLFTEVDKKQIWISPQNTTPAD